MCVDFVKQSHGHLKNVKQNYEQGYQQCTNDVNTFLHGVPEVSIVERQRLLNHLSTASNRRYQPYRVNNSHHTIVNEWFHRCGSSGKQTSLIDSSSSERSNTSSPTSIDDCSERSSTSSSLSSSLWRPW
jgi:hypothetical protein